MKAQELKNSILKHAMEGKLTPQNTNDEPVDNLLFRIEKEINSSIENTSLISDLTNNSSYDIPKSWRWIRLDQLIYKIQYGYTASAQKSGNVKLLRITDIQNNQVNWNDVPYCDIPENRISSYTLDENDIVIARTGGTIGKSHIIDEINHTAVFASYLIRIKPVKEINVNFLKKFLESPLYWSQLRAMSSGTGQPNVNATNLKKLLIPLPPIEEQDRILKKIERLFQRVSRYDYLEQKLTVLNDNFPNNMERSVLQYAAQGKLVPQIDAEESSKVLLNDIKKLNKNFAKYDQISKEDNVPFEIPSTWSWVKLGQLGVTQTGTTPKKSNPENFNGNIPFIKPADITGKSINYDNECLTEVGLRNGRKVDEYSILMVCIGSIGKCYYTDKVVSCNQQINALTPYVSDVKFLYYMLSAPFFQQQAWKNSSSTTLPILNKTKWSNLLIPLAPLDEQRRIVEKIEEIFNSNQKLNMLIK